MGNGANMTRRKWVKICCVAFVLGLIFTATSHASNEAAAEPGAETTEQGSNVDGVKAIAAALAIGISAIATAIAQARIGAAGMGAIAENPKRLGGVIMLVAIPETVAILGFVIAYLIIS